MNRNEREKNNFRNIKEGVYQKKKNIADNYLFLAFLGFYAKIKK